MKSSPYRGGWYPWYVMLLLSISYMFSYIDRSLIYLLVDPIKQDLGLSDLQMSLLQGIAFGLFYAMMGIPIARLADKHNRKVIIATGVALWSLMTVCCGLARNYTQLFFSRMGVGVGEAALVPAAVSLMADYFPRDQLARANAFLTMGGAIGSGVSLLLGGTVIAMANRGIPQLDFLLTDMAPWQKVFVIVGLPGLLLSLIIFTTAKEPLRVNTTNTDAGTRIVDVIAFIRSHSRIFVTLMIAFPMLSMAITGWLAWLPTFFSRHYALAPETAAYWYGITTLICGVSGTLFAGFVTDKLMAQGHTDAALKIAIVSALAMTLLGVLAPNMPTQALSLVLIGVFIFFMSFVTILPALTVQLIAPFTMRAQLTSVVLLITLIIGSLGLTVVALFTDLVFADEADLGKSLSITAGILCLPAALIINAGRKNFCKVLALN